MDTRNASHAGPQLADAPVDARADDPSLAATRRNLETLLDGLRLILAQCVRDLTDAGRADHAAAGSALERGSSGGTSGGGPAERGARTLQQPLAAPLAPCGLAECVVWGAFLGSMGLAPRGVIDDLVDALRGAGVLRLSYGEAMESEHVAMNSSMTGRGAQAVFAAFVSIYPDSEPAGLGVNQGPCRTAAERLGMLPRPAGQAAGAPVTARTLRIAASALCRYYHAACESAIRRVATARTAAELYELVFVAFDVAEFLRWPAPVEARDVVMAALERSMAAQSSMATPESSMAARRSMEAAGPPERPE